ncbi:MULTISPECIES: flavin reductase family protein [unclassified Novosphingobium]|nr:MULTISPECIES: flavin reductase family protein [unclassified Novosphingobium]MBB3359992.1 flavin reductase [Novosphingobium sp. BK256]MBB3376351.1 flavin reductase [Novosphingobium sp. BK280]MBB3479624.1 flavin reductase [Novosphingobium sp. BK369]MBB3622708.1 flavin reductase [Novosphingobium sp. BK592]NOX07297.1 flavin reductase [Novosphingobium sp. SG754]
MDNASSIAPDDTVLRTAFLEQMRQVPGAVAIIASAQDDDAGGLVATAWSSLCADPPMLLACVNRSASAHDLILSTGAFGLSLLSAQDSAVVGQFAGKAALAGKDRFAPGLWRRGPAGQPLLESATVAFECALEATHSHGTHTILIGKVGAMHRNATAAALLYLDGKFASAVPA